MKIIALALLMTSVLVTACAKKEENKTSASPASPIPTLSANCGSSKCI